MPRKKKEELTTEFEHIWGPMSSERMRALMVELSSWVRYKERDEKIGDFIEARDSLKIGMTIRFHDKDKIIEATVSGILEEKIRFRLKDGSIKMVGISKLEV